MSFSKETLLCFFTSIVESVGGLIKDVHCNGNESHILDCPHSKIKEKQFSETSKPSPPQNSHFYGHSQPAYDNDAYTGFRPNNPNQKLCQKLAHVDCYRKENNGFVNLH